jgi:hypothetical protein
VQDRKLNPISVVLWLLAVWMAAGDGGGCNFPLVNDPPPFKTDKLAVLVVEEQDDRNLYAPGQREAMIAQSGSGSIRGYVDAKGGDYLLLDDDHVLTPQTAPWVAEAFGKAKGRKLPSIIAATPSSGLGPRELPKDASETISLLKKIGGE